MSALIIGLAACFDSPMNEKNWQEAQKNKTVIISGFVSIDGEPLSDVHLHWGQDSTSTSKDGKFAITLSKNANSTVLFTKNGYEFQGTLFINNLEHDSSGIEIKAGLKEYLLTSAAQGPGSVSPLGYNQAKHGSSMAFNANPASNAKFRYWKVNGDSASAQQSYTLSDIRNNTTIVGIFE